MQWRRLNGEPLEPGILVSVEDALKTEKLSGNALKVCIGTDSQVKGNFIEMATVVVFVRQKKGGFMFISKERIKQVMGIRERMIYEVARSIGVAHELCPLLEKHGIALEVQAGINTSPCFKSNVALNEAMGYIKGMGFEFKAKPDAFASSYCADKVV